MRGAKYVRRGGAAHAALARLRTNGGICVRAEVLAAMFSVTRSAAYVEEAYASLAKRGFITIGLVRITDEGLAALAASEERHARRSRKAEGGA